MSLIFNKIENNSIFTRDFNSLTNNNEIRFPNLEQIAVVYGPNGTGKTSLIKVLGGANGTKLQFSLDGVEYDTGTDVFHIINDQNNRNIISGSTQDFFLGDNIQREFQLQEQVNSDRKDLISTLITSLKNTFGISAGNSPLIDLIQDENLCALIKDCANNRSKGARYTTETLVSILTFLTNTEVPDYNLEKVKFVQTDLSNKNSIINRLGSLIQTALVPNAHIREIEENTEAIGILSRFHKNKCIVCDTDDIDWEALLEAKTINRQTTLDSLDDSVKETIEQTILLVSTSDPFNIKESLINAIADADITTITVLYEQIKEYMNIYNALLVNHIVDVVSNNGLVEHYAEYKRIIDERPSIDDEDYLYIQAIINSSMKNPLSVDRDENNSLRIYLSNQEFLGKERNELPLSSGEQNFLSLTFELLKARKSECPIVIIDDPISSFDSIYKNKVTYSIVKMLHNKKRLILTHNIDLIRLLDCQYKKCFKLYLLNNTDGEENGFIPLNYNEQEMLINLEKLLTAFRERIPQYVMNWDLFLISMIPFMRGYSNIINRKDIFDALTQVMHGYKTESVDVAKIYAELFGEHEGRLPESYEVSVADILTKTVDGTSLIDTNEYPLLDRTLRHSFTYLFLRLMVEKKLVEKFDIDTTQNEMLGQIITAAYPESGDIEQMYKRIQLTSKKTLVNEFNHFEGNLSIFQPAIDITNQMLDKERTDLMTFIHSL